MQGNFALFKLQSKINAKSTLLPYHKPSRGQRPSPVLAFKTFLRRNTPHKKLILKLQLVTEEWFSCLLFCNCGVSERPVTACY